MAGWTLDNNIRDTRIRKALNTFNLNNKFRNNWSLCGKNKPVIPKLIYKKQKDSQLEESTYSAEGQNAVLKSPNLTLINHKIKPLILNNLIESSIIIPPAS